MQSFFNANSIGFKIIDAAAIKSGAVNLSDFSVLYMRTGAEPTAYNDPDVISKISSRIQNGGGLIIEYYGLYLAQYMGTGTIGTLGWGPCVMDGAYFVQPEVSSPLFYKVSNWSPPTLPDQDSQLITKLTVTGVPYYYPVLTFNSDLSPQTIQYDFLYTTYGWYGQAADSTYCLANLGLCTSERSVFDTSNASWFLGHGVGDRLIEEASFGTGKIFKLALNMIQAVPANNMVIGPVANQIRLNAINNAEGGGFLLFDSGAEWRYTGIAPSGWTQTGFDDSQWNAGTTPFDDHSVTNWCNFSRTGTNWPLNTSLYLRKSMIVTQQGDITLKVAIDNDFVLYFDGKQIASVVSEGCAYKWQYEYKIPGVAIGTHTIAVKITDRGDDDAFDMMALISTAQPAAPVCDFSTQRPNFEMCFGAIGDKCSGDAPGSPSFQTDLTTCLIDGWVAAGSIKHDKCCFDHQGVGFMCSGVASTRSVRAPCYEDFEEAGVDLACHFYWEHEFGPYYSGATKGDNTKWMDTPGALKAPSGTPVMMMAPGVLLPAWGAEETYCQSGRCQTDAKGKTIVKTKICPNLRNPLLPPLIPARYCICE
jgi:hypothetical protein